METTKMKIEYRKLTDNESDPWLLLTNIDELIWNGVYALRVIDDDGSLGLPFRFENDDTVTLVLKDHAHEGKLQNSRTVVQTITRVERVTGKVFTYTRARYCVEGKHRWNVWEQAKESESDSVVDNTVLQQIEINKVDISNEVKRATEAEGLLSDRIKELEDNPNTVVETYQLPKATESSLGGVIIGGGLSVDEDGNVSISDKAIDESKLSDDIKNKINEPSNIFPLLGEVIINDGIALHYGALIENSAPYTGTRYSVYSDKIISNGETLIVNSGYRILSYKIFDGEQETFFSSNLNENSLSLYEKGCYYQIEFSKANSTAFTDSDLPNIVKIFVRNPVIWGANKHVDNFITPGNYNISGNRSSIYDGLPTSDTGTFNARLTVLANGSSVTQILSLLNVGDGCVYIRTQQYGAWKPWKQLLTDVPEKSVTENKLSDDVTLKLNNINIQTSLLDTIEINDGITFNYGALLENSDPYSGTKYSVYSDKILSNGETLIVNAGYKITGYKIFDEDIELLYCENYNERSLFLEEKGHYYQIAIIKEDSTVFTDSELLEIVKLYVRKPVLWDGSKHLDSFITQGNYNIRGTRSNSSDGFPTTDTGKFAAQLTVLICENFVMQKLMLLSATSGIGNVYLRTKQGTTWGSWKTLF